MYDSIIQDSIAYNYFLRIKRIIKLCNNYESIKKDEVGSEHTYTYGLIFKALISYCNALAKKAKLDVCGDETTFVYMEYGESDSDIL